jgi:hypothetical protein
LIRLSHLSRGWHWPMAHNNWIMKTTSPTWGNGQIEQCCKRTTWNRGQYVASHSWCNRLPSDSVERRVRPSNSVAVNRREQSPI